MRSNKDLKKENEVKRKKASLTHQEWMPFFFLAFFTPKPKYREDPFSPSELERFKAYHFQNKIKEAITAKSEGHVFWFIILVITIFFLPIIVLKTRINT